MGGVRGAGTRRRWAASGLEFREGRCHGCGHATAVGGPDPRVQGREVCWVRAGGDRPSVACWGSHQRSRIRRCRGGERGGGARRVGVGGVVIWHLAYTKWAAPTVGE